MPPRQWSAYFTTKPPAQSDSSEHNGRPNQNLNSILMNPKCRFCNGEQESYGFRRENGLTMYGYRCNACLVEQTYHPDGSLLEFTLRIPTDKSVKFDHGNFHYVLDFDPITMNLSVRSYGKDCGWQHHFEIKVKSQPSWLHPSLSEEKIKTLILFS
jgi:hypothetical protein